MKPNIVSKGNTEPTFDPYLRPPVQLTEADPGMVKFFAERLAKNPEIAKLIGPEAFATITEYQPNSRTVLGTGIGYAQGGFIGSVLLPEYVGGADEKADYPVFGKELFYKENTTLNLGARPKRLDINLSFNTVKLNVHAAEVATDKREIPLSGSLPVGIEAFKSNVLRTQIKNEKESEQADLLRTTGNYAAGYSETLSGTSQWSDGANAKPIAAVFAKRQKVFKATRRMPDTFWMGPDVLTALATNDSVRATAYAGGIAATAAPVSMEALAAIFRMSLVVGDAGISTSPTGDPTDLWGNDAGILWVGRGEVIAPRFGITLTSEGYPSVQLYDDDTVGPKGASVEKYADGWNVIALVNKAGYLWKAASASY